MATLNSNAAKPATKLASKISLRKLQPQNEPYWERLGGTSGAFVPATRKTADAGAWTAAPWRAGFSHREGERQEGATSSKDRSLKAGDFNEARESGPRVDRADRRPA